jgi:CBS domain-containing protein
MRVSELMSTPARSCSVTSSVQEAARLMWEFGVGTVPVVDPENRLVGVITDRDVGMAAYSKGRALSEIAVEIVMSAPAFSCVVNDEMRDVVTRMLSHQHRRMPVVNEHHEVVGLISLDDAQQGANSDDVVTDDGFRARADEGWS